MYEIFKRLLEEKGLKAYDVCKATGIPSSSITDWKKGRYTPKADKMQKIADFLGVSLEYLMTGTQQSTPGLSNETLDIAYYIEQNPDFKTFVEVAKRSDRRQLDILREYMEKLNALEGVRG